MKTLMLATGMAIGLYLANICLAADAHQPASAMVFQQGIAAFRAGHYKEALRDFLLARQHGMSDPHLTYNLGVSYYHLGDYTAARREFFSLAQNRDLAALSDYNLGLIALRQGDKPEAGRRFQLAYDGAPEPALKQLASRQLARLGSPAAPHTFASAWVGFANLGTGYDSNVTLTSQNSLLAPAQRGSAVLSLLAGTVGQLTGDYRQGMQIVGTVYRIDYPSVGQFSQTYLRLGGKYKFGNDDWANAIGVYGGHISLGGSSFETLGTVKAESRYAFSPSNELRGDYSYARISGGGNYGYLSGWHQALNIEDTTHLTPVDLSLGYSLDLNNRNNLSTPTQFLSVSPTRNGVFGRIKWQYSDATSFFVESTFQHSRYNQANTLVQNGVTTSLTRVDNWRTLAMGANHAFSNAWNVHADYHYTRNSSNIPLYAYDSNAVMLSLEYLFL